jgi:hypothetical protein
MPSNATSAAARGNESRIAAPVAAVVDTSHEWPGAILFPWTVNIPHVTTPANTSRLPNHDSGYPSGAPAPVITITPMIERAMPTIWCVPTVSFRNAMEKPTVTTGAVAMIRTRSTPT